MVVGGWVSGGVTCKDSDSGTVPVSCRGGGGVGLCNVRGRVCVCVGGGGVRGEGGERWRGAAVAQQEWTGRGGGGYDYTR